MPDQLKPQQIMDAITFAPPGSVIIVRGLDGSKIHELRLAMETWVVPDQAKDSMMIFLDQGQPVEVLDEEAMGWAGWFRGDPTGDEDESLP